jgi:hypothetical protein
MERRPPATSHFSPGNVAQVTFRQLRLSHHRAAVALALHQESHIANFVTPPAFLGHPFFSLVFREK